MDKDTKANRNVMKLLSELTLLDRFLFANTMEDRDTLQMVISIILGRDICLADRPQTEKEIRTTPWLRSIRLDVYTLDQDSRVYNTEVQQRNTGNLIKRSRFYQALIDSSLLLPGEIDFNDIPPSYLITIMPFDLWGCGRYKYTFEMKCREEDGLFLKDGAIRIFLNTRGTIEDGVSRELIDLLHYMEKTSDEEADQSHSERIKKLHRRVSQVRSSEEIGVRFMQEWEERVYELREATEKGRAAGENIKLIGQVRKKASKNISAQDCAEMLEEETSLIEKIYDIMKQHPDWDDARVYEAIKTPEQRQAGMDIWSRLYMSE